MEKNSRIDLHDLALMLGTDEITVANEIAEMEKEHIICGYHMSAHASDRIFCL